MPNFTTENNILDSLIASVIFHLIFILTNSIHSKFKYGFASYRLFSNAIVASWLVPILLLMVWMAFYITAFSLVSASIVTIYILGFSFFVLVKELLRFRGAGILGIDEQVHCGVNYKKALKLTKKNLKFLGTGGHKLTEHRGEFLDAIKSATDHKPAQFLLCHPESNALKLMARKNNVGELEYIQNVKSSLIKLKGFIDNGSNIEVRLYRANTIADMPIFRLMFFNNQYCLCSYNIFGNKDKGTSAPQLHLYAPPNHDDKNSYYKAFEVYFECLWEKSEPGKLLSSEDWIGMKL